MERYRIHEALVATRKTLPNGDVILGLVSPRGSFNVVARKAQRPVGRSGRLSLFHHVRFQAYHKPGNDLPTLTQVELLGRLEGLEAHGRFAWACILMDMAYKLGANPETALKVWPVLVSGLKGIAKQPQPNVAWVWAGWRMMSLAGFSPNLQGQGDFLFQGMRNRHGMPIAPYVQVLQACCFGSGVQAVEALEGDPTCTKTLEGALLDHIRFTMGELRSFVALSNQ